MCITVEFIYANFSGIEHLRHLFKAMNIWKNIKELIYKDTTNKVMFTDDLSKFGSDTTGFYKHVADTLYLRLLKAI